VSIVGVGIDLVDIDRFRTSLKRTPSMRARLFTPAELDDVAAQADDVPSLAARFAAREAVMKSLGRGLGAFGFHDVWVERLDSGAPLLHVTGPALALADDARVTHWHLSLTHSDSTAAAHVVAESRTGSSSD